MKTLYKITTEEGWSLSGGAKVRLWRDGATHRTDNRSDPNGASLIHAYESPLLAALMSRERADASPMILWEAEGEPIDTSAGFLFGCSSLTTLRRTVFPIVTPKQRARFAIFCALQVCPDHDFGAWATAWLEGRDQASAFDLATEAASRAEEAAEHAEDSYGDVAERSVAAAKHAIRASRARGYRPMDLSAIAEAAVAA